ncbi:DUF4871 domain-containing protein [Paenibacillus sp. Soil522]|uniref:DUF4871 domain-containing protein n=1 Tax=Paenibacillus sp. Soil522 TaxID=1736388 RepID=UPI0006F8740A|nr:DUF4871 domain-containing protein [Paenibacillus sp. Soil522]KRE44973.1 hypothetical protein ASG81_14935 [Paenibacillus sp. Soil522]
MLNIYRTCLLIAVLFIFSGCTEAANTAVEISPTFTSEGLEMQGIEGKIGILGSEFIAGKPNKHMWHFWGTKEELSANFRVEAVNTNTGEKINPFTLDNPTPIGGPNNGADGHVPSSMELPEPGVWQLDAYLDANLFGSITVEVK